MRQDFINNEPMVLPKGCYASPSMCVITMETMLAILTGSTIYNTNPTDMGEQNVF